MSSIDLSQFPSAISQMIRNKSKTKLDRLMKKSSRVTFVTAFSTLIVILITNVFEIGDQKDRTILPLLMFCIGLMWDKFLDMQMVPLLLENARKNGQQTTYQYQSIKRKFTSDDLDQILLDAYHSEAIIDKDHLIGSTVDVINALITEEQIKIKQDDEN